MAVPYDRRVSLGDELASGNEAHMGDVTRRGNGWRAGGAARAALTRAGGLERLDLELQRAARALHHVHDLDLAQAVHGHAVERQQLAGGGGNL